MLTEETRSVVDKEMHSPVSGAELGAKKVNPHKFEAPKCFAEYSRSFIGRQQPKDHGFDHSSCFEPQIAIDWMTITNPRK